MLETALEYNKATAYLERNNFNKAFPIYKKLLRKGYEYKEVLVNIGNCYRAQGEDRKMIEAYSRALDPKVPYLSLEKNIKTDTVQHALNNLGLARYMFGDDDGAIELYERAIKRDPTFWECWWNCSTAYLRKASGGEVDLFPKAWEMYNSRFLKSTPVTLKNDNAALQYWKPGEFVDSIVVLSEQGLGDYIMFGRYLSALQKFCNKIYVQCDESLHSIFSDYECIFNPSEVPATNAYPICSLAGAIGEILPGDWLKGKYGTRKFDNSRPNVGIVWAGSPTHANNANRSVSINRFHRLANHCNLYSLTPGFSGDRYVKPLGIKTWTDTAECINGLDLVIGVDTSVIHMAGSLGAETWMLQPLKETDFRWGHGSSVWYDSVKIYQNPNSWEVVFNQVEKDLVNRFKTS